MWMLVRGVEDKLEHVTTALQEMATMNQGVNKNDFVGRSMNDFSTYMALLKSIMMHLSLGMVLFFWSNGMKLRFSFVGCHGKLEIMLDCLNQIPPLFFFLCSSYSRGPLVCKHLKAYAPPDKPKPDMVKKNLCTMVHVFHGEKYPKSLLIPYQVKPYLLMAVCIGWPDIKTGDGGRQVIWLDVNKEAFGLIEHPKTICDLWRNDSCPRDELVHPNGEVGYMCTRTMDVWLLNHKKEWVPQHCQFKEIDPDSYIDVIGCWNKDGDILLIMSICGNSLYASSLASSVACPGWRRMSPLGWNLQSFLSFICTQSHYVKEVTTSIENTGERFQGQQKGKERWPLRVTLGRLLPHARGLGFKPRREVFPSGAKKEWGLSPKAKVRVLHTAQLDVTVPQNYNASSAMPCLFIHILCYSLSLYPFTERYAQPYFFSCLIRQTLCLLKYALMKRHDYDITSSLRRGALHLLFFIDQTVARGIDLVRVIEDCQLGSLGLVNFMWKGTWAHGISEGSVTVRVRVQVLLWDEGAIVINFGGNFCLCLLEQEVSLRLV
uniref:Uncharacterized protein n=1 Tax=Tanacetum cinerariifolium TaxID=118510 RepID=A0A6L2L4M1_TANCI|nr:hypothetical protein [Tanacetum cinerariifolium]